MRFAQHGVQRAVPTHEKEHAGGGGNASQKTREEGHHGAQIGERAHQRRKAELLHEHMQRRGVLAQALRFAMKGQHFGIGAEEEE